MNATAVTTRAIHVCRSCDATFLTMLAALNHEKELGHYSKRLILKRRRRQGLHGPEIQWSTDWELDV